jgi:hypothetical protein
VLGVATHSCYFMAITPQSWPDARQSCWDAGQKLVTVGSPEEDELIAGLSRANLWIGASDLQQDGQFVWTDDKPIRFSNWGASQPDDYPGPDCVEKRQEPGEPWYDQPCANLRYYVCERPAE